jgi:hypothetical protein
LPLILQQRQQPQPMMQQTAAYDDVASRHMMQPQPMMQPMMMWPPGRMPQQPQPMQQPQPSLQQQQQQLHDRGEPTLGSPCGADGEPTLGVADDVREDKKYSSTYTIVGGNGRGPLGGSLPKHELRIVLARMEPRRLNMLSCQRFSGGTIDQLFYIATDAPPQTKLCDIIVGSRTRFLLIANAMVQYDVKGKPLHDLILTEADINTRACELGWSWADYALIDTPMLARGRRAGQPQMSPPVWAQQAAPPVGAQQAPDRFSYLH